MEKSRIYVYAKLSDEQKKELEEQLKGYSADIIPDRKKPNLYLVEIVTGFANAFRQSVPEVIDAVIYMGGPDAPREVNESDELCELFQKQMERWNVPRNGGEEVQLVEGTDNATTPFYVQEAKTLVIPPVMYTMARAADLRSARDLMHYMLEWPSAVEASLRIEGEAHARLVDHLFGELTGVVEREQMYADLERAVEGSQRSRGARPTDEKPSINNVE